MSVEVPDSGQVHTLPELITALQALRAGRSYTELNKAAGGRLPSSTLSDLLNKGRASRETLEVFLRACQVSREQWPAWQQARERALSVDDLGAAGLIRVAQADPRRLGVHAAVDAPGATGELPLYVPRDTDTAPDGVRALIKKAATGGRGGLVVLVGGSSVGKTRCAYEAVRELLPAWWLLHPADAEHVRRIAETPPPRLVIWLDALQRYLDGPNKLRPATARALLQRGAVLVATLWPEPHRAYTATLPAGQPNLYADERELLGLADVAHIGETFSPAERERARQTAEAGDVRIALALRSNDYGLTQVIAAAPQLIDRWKGADAYAAAVLNAAIDATRLGVASPLPAALLRQAAPGYCDARQRAKAKPNWFETALAYLTEELRGAAAALGPVASSGDDMGQAAGYMVADYLQQHVGHARRTAKVPATCWQALTDHLTDPGELARVGDAAEGRLLYGYAKPLYQRAACAGHQHAAKWLADLLARQGHEEEALAVLRELVTAGDGGASFLLADLLADLGRTAELRELIAAGDRDASWRLADLLARQGQEEEALAVWRELIAAGDDYAFFRLAELLIELGREDEAITVLRQRDAAVVGDESAAQLLADLLIELGQEEEALAVWQELADAGDDYASWKLAELLASLGRAEALTVWRGRDAAGDESASWRLAQLLVALGQEEEALAILRDRVAAGAEKAAAWLLANLLTQHGQEEEALAVWQELADAGDDYASWALTELLARSGRKEDALAMLRNREAAGDRAASWRIAALLAELGQVEELWERTQAGDRDAANGLIKTLDRLGRVEEAERIRRHGLDAD
ncbi:tetratricopeptide repeat protein [Nonomuraea dietziae]|uniref:tetratricopeptide repeat protein n=1 Tax=Nonomuraea dietziae TaxID=65515 RepID=UPI0033F2780E